MFSGSVDRRHLHYPVPSHHNPAHEHLLTAAATRELCLLSSRRTCAVAEASPRDAHRKPLVPGRAAGSASRPAPQPRGEFSGGGSVETPRAPHRRNTVAAASNPFAQAQRAGDRRRRGGQSTGPGRSVGPAAPGGGSVSAGSRGRLAQRSRRPARRRTGAAAGGRRGRQHERRA